MSEQEQEPNPNDNKKPIPIEPKDDLLNLNEPSDVPISNDGKIQEEPDFNISDYHGFPMEEWVKYQGTINDNKQRRRVAIAGLEHYKIRYNRSNDDDLPEWSVLDLEYFPITVSAWQRRQTDLARIEDKNREIGALDLQLSEIQNSIRIRTLRANKAETASDLSKQSLEDLQKNIVALQALSNDMRQSLQNAKNTADRYAFKIYFHKDEQTFDGIRSDDLEDILGACDWKQTQGAANLLPSKNSPIKGSPGVR
jgi:hypothetical protein